MTTVPDRNTFETAYTGQAPWDIGRPQQAFLDVADRITGSVLDAGCGTGDNALFFASRGHKVTGIDFLEGPITRARRKATERGLSATFFVMDALTLQDPPEVFDRGTESGPFHVFFDEDRKRYVEGRAPVLKPGGRLFLLCFSDDEPRTQGHGGWCRTTGRKATQPGEATCLTGPHQRTNLLQRLLQHSVATNLS
jgi:SAM-dependent methyltransferase